MKKVGGCLIIIILLVIAGITSIGFLARPVDLGIKADPTFVSAFEARYGKPNGSGKISLDVTLSGQDITSIFATWEKRDPNFPLHNVQVRLNSDGTGEATGIVKIGTAIKLAQNLGYSSEEIDKGKAYIKYISGDLPFYVKGTGGMVQNNLTIEPETFRIGPVPVPQAITKLAAGAVVDMIEWRLTQIGGANITDATFKNGAFHLEGLVPETIHY